MTGWLSRLVGVLVLGCALAASPVAAFADTPSPSPSSPSAEPSASVLPGPEPVAASPTYLVALGAEDRGLVLDWMTATAWGLGLTVLASSAGLILLVRR